MSKGRLVSRYRYTILAALIGTVILIGVWSVLLAKANACESRPHHAYVRGIVGYKCVQTGP